MFSTGANYGKLKTNLRLAISRLKLLQKKKAELALKARREIADYIRNGKYERAKIRVEHIIREDYLVEAMEMIEMYCDLLLARFGLIQQMKAMDEGLAEPISTIIWAAPRLQTDIAEMKVISDQFTFKYGKPYTQSVLMSSIDTVNKKLMRKLGVQAPSKILVEHYMIEIAKTNNLEYEPDADIMRDDPVEAVLVDFNNDDKPSGPDGGDNIGGGGFIFPSVQFSEPTDKPFSYPPPPPGLYLANSVDPPPYSALPPSGQNVQPIKYQPPPDVMYPTLPSTDTTKEKPPMKPPRQETKNSAAQNTNISSNNPFPELPSVPSVASAPEESVDFDYLTKRFEELKKRPT